jgi:hypothetical protein
MTSFTNFQKIISFLENNEFDYRVYGGFAFDGMRGQITREHKDIDLYINADQFEKFKNIFPISECSFILKTAMYFIEAPDLKIGVVLFIKEDNQVIANGNHTVVRIPNAIWNYSNYLTIDEVRFNCVPNELLVFDCQYSIHDDDKRLATQIKYDRNLFDQIKVIEAR